MLTWFPGHTAHAVRAALGAVPGEHDWEETPAALLFEEPGSLDDDAMRAALRHVCAEFEYLDEDSCVGTSADLEEFFSIIERVYRRCSPMNQENESLPLRWIEGRLW